MDVFAKVTNGSDFTSNSLDDGWLQRLREEQTTLSSHTLIPLEMMQGW